MGFRAPSAGILSPVASRTPSQNSSNKSRGFLNVLNLSRNNSSSSTLVGSAYERKVVDAQIPPEPKVDTTGRLTELRKLMVKEKIDYYVIPSTDAHGSEYIASCDRRREWISGFTGSAGTAIVSATNAYLFVDSRYYIQGAREIDQNWTLLKVGWEDIPQWDAWLIARAKGTKIGVDSRMISYTLAAKLNAALTPRASSLVYPWQNLVDLIWKDRPLRPRDPIFLQPLQFAGEDAQSKLSILRKWIRESVPEMGLYTTKPPSAAQTPIATFVSNLASIAWLLNLRGSDIPFNPVFQAYLFVSLDRAILFIDSAKVSEEIGDYLESIGVSTREYSDVWPFLRGKDWGEGKVLVSADIPYTVPRSLTSMRYTIAPSFIEQQKAIKNDVEIVGFERAYLRDGAAMVRWYAWLDEKISHGYEITEYQASQRLTEFRSKSELYAGLAYENISACGPNAALPHYTPPRHDSRVIDRDTPFLMDSGGQYRDGTCDTTRTVHFGRPTNAQSEAYTRVLQGHIAIDSAIFPEGTTGAKLDVLARRALWQDGLNYGHGTGHGVGSFLNVSTSCPHGFGIDVPLEPGHILTNEPGFYLEGEWGVRIESALVVRRVHTKGQFQGNIWLGFKRFTQVPIQVKMIKASLLSTEERAWVRDHNDECRRKLEPLLRDDKRALRWLRKECQPGFRSETSISGVSVEWD
ncbi:Creatinase/aminopeptidase [Ramaria rubella]|nr:Creatinase/aminopeptidase [Ramaria rubella]